MKTISTLNMSAMIAMLSHYELGVYVKSEPFTTGWVQENVRLTTSKGEFALKFYHSRSRARVVCEMDMLSFLSERGLAVPMPVANADGEWVSEYEGTPYTICNIVSGHHIEEPTLEHLKQVAACSAQMHKVSRHYSPPPSSQDMDERQIILSYAQAEADKHVDYADGKEKLEWVRGELDALESCDSLPRGICHYDYGPSNFMFENGVLSGLVDFDDARYTHAIFEIANLGDFWAWPDGGSLDFDRMRQLLAEYEIHRPLKAVEKRHLFDAWKSQILLDTVYFFTRGTADDFKERRKVDTLKAIGRERFLNSLFA